MPETNTSAMAGDINSDAGHSHVHMTVDQGRAALVYFLRPWIRPLMAIAVISLAAALLEMLSLAALYPTLSYVSGGTASSGNALVDRFDQIARQLGTVIGTSPLRASVILLIALTIAKLVTAYIRDLMTAFSSYAIRRDVQERLFDIFLHAPLSFHVESRQGDLIHRVIQSPSLLGQLVFVVPTVFAVALNTLLMVGFLFVTSPAVTAALLGMIATYFFVARVLSRRISFVTGRGRVEEGEKQTACVAEAFRGIKSIKIYDSADLWQERFHQATMKFFKYVRRDDKAMHLPHKLLELFVVCGLAMFLFMIADSSDLMRWFPALGIFGFAMLKLLPYLNQVGRLQLEGASLMPNAIMLHRVFMTASKWHGHSDDRPDAPCAFREVRFDDVSFRYPDADRNVLTDVQFAVKSGDFVGVSGTSGAGKTTLLDLLVGLQQPSAGRILVDGTELTAFEQRSWRERIGYVGQEPFLLNGTVRENVLFGRPRFTDEQVASALRMAGAWDFVCALPKGLDATISDNGSNLSGGQRQRMCIARAILNDPLLVVLDEATSALDAATEEQICRTVRSLVRDEGRTVIFVTHRAKPIQEADRVVRIEDCRLTSVLVQA